MNRKRSLFMELIHNMSECITIDYPAGNWPGKKFSFINPNGRGMHEFDKDKCIGCEACRNICPNYSINVVDKGKERTISVFLGRCTFCGRCMNDCPEEAIILTPKYEFANTSKEGLYIENNVERIKCKDCGEYMFPDKQIKRVKERILEKIEEEVKEIFKKDMEIYLKYCPECRKKISYEMKTNTVKYY